MATLEKPRIRTSSITIALPTLPIRELHRKTPSSSSPYLPSTPLHPPASPLLRIVDSSSGQASFVLPSVPTSEPTFRRTSFDTIYPERAIITTNESDLSDRGSSDLASISGSAALSALSASRSHHVSDFDETWAQEGEGGNDAVFDPYREQVAQRLEEDEEEENEIGDEEEEEVLEELVDDPIESAGETSDRQENDLAGLVLATQAAALLALQTLLKQLHGLALQKITSSEHEQQITDSTAESSVVIMDDALHIVAQVSERSQDRAEPLAKLNDLLDSLSTMALTAGSTSNSSTNDSLNLAVVLGELLQSLQKIQLPHAGRAAVESAQRQARSTAKVRTGSVSTLASTSSHSPSVSREELRNPFAEIFKPDVFATLHRLLSALAARCPEPQRQTDPKGRSFDESRTRSSFFGPSTNRQQAVVTRDDLTTGETSTAAWSHVNQIIGLTRDLVASRRATTSTSLSSFYDYNGSYSPLRSRSRTGSAASSNPDVAEVSRSINSTHRTSSRLNESTVSTPTVQSHRGSLIRKHGSLSSLEGANSTASGSLPPRYSDDGVNPRQRKGSGASEGQIKDYQARGILPAYGYEEKSAHRQSMSRSAAAYPEKGILLSSPSLSTTSEMVHVPSSPKTYNQHPDISQTSSDAVFMSASHLANQKLQAGAQRGRNIDSTLEELIDRLAVSGQSRMEDQRSTPKLKTSARWTGVEHADGANKTSSVLKKLSSTAQLASTFRRGGHAIASNSNKISVLASRIGDEANPAVGSHQPDTQTRARRSAHVSLRNIIFKDSWSEAKQLQRQPLSNPDSSPMSVPFPPPRGNEDAELFDLLAKSEIRTRLSDQEAVMRPPCRRHHTLSMSGSRSDCEQQQQDQSTSGNASPSSACGDASEQPKAHSHDEDFRFGAGQRKGSAPIVSTRMMTTTTMEEDRIHRGDGRPRTAGAAPSSR